MKKVLTGEIGPEQTGRIGELEKVQFRRSVFPPVDVNVVVADLDEPLTGYGQIRCGTDVVTDAVFRGAIVDKKAALEDARRRKERQEKPIFPFQTEGVQGRLL